MLPVLENLYVAKVQAPNDLINATQPHEVQKILFSVKTLPINNIDNSWNWL